MCVCEWHGMLPTTRAGKVTVGVLAVFTVAMNPPVITLVDAPRLVAGMSSLYLWTVGWGVAITLVLVWAAWRDAFALTEDQVPPELREADETAVAESAGGRSTAGGDA